MNALWTFEGGRLVAYDPAGVKLAAWLADEAMGPRLPDINFYLSCVIESIWDG